MPQSNLGMNENIERSLRFLVVEVSRSGLNSQKVAKALQSKSKMNKTLNHLLIYSGGHHMVWLR
jgi:diphthamide synthase (EF-2-diphthine--ammonia ligase)